MWLALWPQMMTLKNISSTSLLIQIWQLWWWGTIHSFLLFLVPQDKPLCLAIHLHPSPALLPDRGYSPPLPRHTKKYVLKFTLSTSLTSKRDLYFNACIVTYTSIKVQVTTKDIKKAWHEIPQCLRHNMQMISLKAMRQLVWRLLLRWKNVLDWKKCPISMFSEIFSPYKHVLAALFRK